MDKNFSLYFYIPRNVYMYVFLLVPLIHIEGLAFIAPVIYFFLYRICTIISFIVVSVLFIFSLYKYKKLNRFILTTILIATLNIILTIINNGDVINVLGIWTYILPVLFLFDIFKEDVCVILDVLYWYLLMVVLINFVLIILYPNGLFPEGVALGLGKIWLLGYKSSLQNFILPLILIAYLRAVYMQKHFMFATVLILGHIECYFSSNSMFLVGLLLCDAIVFSNMVKTKIVSKLVLISVAFGILAFNWILVLFTQDFLSMTYIKWIIMDVLGKDITLSMRTNAWIATVDEIFKNPILGQGYTSLEYREFIFNRPTAHAHNLFLEIIYECGLVGLGLFFGLMNIVMQCVYRFRRFKSARCIYCFCVVIFLMYSFENLLQKSCGLIWLIFIMSNYADLIDYHYSKLNFRRDSMNLLHV